MPLAGLLVMGPVIVLAGGIFLLRYCIGKIAFWGKAYLQQGYDIFQSNLSACCLLDTALLFALCVMGFFMYRFRPSVPQIREMGGVRWLIILVLLVLFSLPFRRSCVFYNSGGLLIVKPFRQPRLVPWEEIGSIRKWRSPQKYYIVLDREGKRLAVFPLNRKTKRFMETARQEIAVL